MVNNLMRRGFDRDQAITPLGDLAPGMERQTAVDSGQAVFAEDDGVVLSCTARHIRVRYDDGREKTYELSKFVRSNQGTCISQRSIVRKGQRLRRGDADDPADLVPEYVTLPRGVQTESGEIEWSHGRR